MNQLVIHKSTGTVLEWFLIDDNKAHNLETADRAMVMLKFPSRDLSKDEPVVINMSGFGVEPVTKSAKFCSLISDNNDPLFITLFVDGQQKLSLGLTL